MTEFFTWAMLATYAGATLATALITQWFKDTGWVAKIPTRIVSYVVALAVLLAAAIFTRTIGWESIGLCMVNAVVVSLASNGAFDAVPKG